MDTREYLEHVYNLEKSCYEQQRLISELQTKAYRVSHPTYEKSVPLKDVKKDAKSSVGNVIGIALIAAAIVGFILLIFNIYPDLYPDFVDSIEDWLYATLSSDGFILGLLLYLLAKIIFIFILGLPVFVIVLIIGLSEASSTKKYNKKTNEGIIAQNNKIAAKNELTKKQIPEKLAIINPQISQLKKCYAETKKTLNDFYSADIIFPKYRNFVAVTTFLEYFASGRCSTLGGHEGAYNIYEQEIRLNLIISKLDDIIERLDQIESNQYMIANAIKESNKKADMVYKQLSNCADSLTRIEANTEVSAYCNRISAINTTYMAWYITK